MAYTGSAEDVVVVNEQLLADVVDDLARRPEFRERRRPSAFSFPPSFLAAQAYICARTPCVAVGRLRVLFTKVGLRLRATPGCWSIYDVIFTIFGNNFRGVKRSGKPTRCD